MRNITKISNLRWLIKHDEFSTSKIELLTDPKPFYSRKRGEMIVFATSTFGPKGWTLPCFEYQFEDDDFKKYVWFTRSLLEGQVILIFKVALLRYREINFIKDLKKYYSTPVDSIKEWSVSPKALSIINKLLNNKIDSHSKILAKWKINSKFLLEEFMEWCKPEYKTKIQTIWPSIINE